MPFGPNAINPGYGQTQNNPTGLSNEVIASNPAQTPGNFVITGGSIDGTPIGITTPAAGNFTTLSASSITLSSPLPIVQGGTGTSTAPSSGKLLIGNASGGYTVANLTAGTGVTITNGNGTITVSAPDVGSVTSVNASAGTTGLSFSGGPITSSGTLTLSGTLAITNGGTGATTASDARTALGVSSTGSDTTYAFRANNLSDLASADTARTNLGLGSIATQASSSVSITGGTITGITDLAVADGGTGVSTVPTNGQLLIGNGTGYTVAALTAGSGISVTNGSGTITIAATGGGGGGTVSSVDVSGGTTGLTFSGGPVTSSGTITMAGILALASGGTGASTAADARTALGVSSTGSDTTYAFRANNLSDLASAATARTNLGLGTIATQNANSVTITGGTINATVIGGSTASAATFTTVSATDQFTSTDPWNAADGGGQIYLNGATGNRIDFASTGAAAPSTTTRSVGTRLVLSPALSSTVTDFAQGIDVNTLWFSVPSTSLTQFKWYGGTTLAATLTGAGVFSAVSIQNTPIGSTTANTGAFTTLSASGATNLDAGTVSAPGLYLEGETSTGLYRIGANNHGYAVSGSKVLDISSTGLSVTGALSSSGIAGLQKLITNGQAEIDANATLEVNGNTPTFSSYLVNKAAVSASNYTALVFQLNTSTNQRSAASLFSRFSTTTDASRVGELEVRVANGAAPAAVAIFTPTGINNAAIGATTPNTGAFTTLTASGVATFSAGTDSAPAITTTGDVNTGIFFPAADTIAFTEGGAEAMRLDSSGRLLVGTSTQIASSTTKLQIAGSGTTAGISLGRTDSPSSGNSFAGIDAYSFDGSTSVAGGTINFRAAEDWSSTNHGTDIQFRTTASGSGGALFEAMRINSSGNVGIGTSSPSYPLQVSGSPSGDSKSFARFGGTWTASANSQSFYNTLCGATVASQTYTGLTYYGFYANTPGLTGTGTIATSYQLYLATGPTATTKYGIYQSGTDKNYFGGDVGIGTASPSYKLHVSGTGADVAATDSTVTTRIIASSAGAAGFLETTSNHPLIFRTNQVERARITTAGNIVAGASAALATTATDGFLYVPTCAGTPTGTPTAITGMAPIVVNTTNNKLYFYSGGAWRDAGP